MTVLSDVSAELSKGVTNVRGWIADIEKHIPALVEKAAQYEQSPIVQALEGAVLPKHVESTIAQLIKDASTDFAGALATAQANLPTSTTAEQATASTNGQAATTTSTPATGA